MPTPNDEFQQYADEYADQRFNESMRRLFSFETLKLVAFMLLWISSWVNGFNFYPSDLGSDVGLGICGILALGLTAWFASHRAHRPDSDTNANQPGIVGTVIAGILGSIFLAPIAFNFCLGLFTALVGTPGQQHAIEDRWGGGIRGYCAGPDLQDVWFEHNIVCLDPHREHEFPAGSHLTLKGKISPLGINVEDAVPHW